MSEPIVITEPGLYDIPEDVYHGDPVPGGSLSSTTAKRLLPPSCPAIAQHEREHPVIKDAYDLGHVVHKLVLGRGGDVAVRPEKWADYKTNAAKAWKAEQRAAGRIPTTPEVMATAEAIAAAVADHSLASALFAPGTGVPERSIFWRDLRTGAWCRAMIDWLSIGEGVIPMIVDLKTTRDPSPWGVDKMVGDYGYYQQAAFYSDAVMSLGLEEPIFVFVFVGTEGPHLVTVADLDPEDIDLGRRRNAAALDIWVKRPETGPWPGYRPPPGGIHRITLSRWATTRYEETEPE